MNRGERTGSPEVIAIDGPAGAGKSTVARALAHRLGLFLLDTGAIYRSLALLARERSIEWTDEGGLAQLAETLPIRFVSTEGAQRVVLDGRDVSDAIRTPQISDGASRVSALPKVRAALLQLQRTIAARGGCVVEGRDIGTVVLPWAPVKFFLTATPEERARRRCAELQERGQAADLASTLAEIQERDFRDQSRDTAPLRAAPDAIVLDTSDLALDEVVTTMERRVKSRLGGVEA